MVFDTSPSGAGPGTAPSAASQRNTPTTQVEPAFLAASTTRDLQALGHKFTISDTSSLDPTIKISPDIGIASGLEYLPDGTVLAAGERARRGGSAAGVVFPTP